MASLELKLKIKVSWWVKYYLYGVAFFCLAFDLDPDWEKIDYWVKKGVRVYGA